MPAPTVGAHAGEVVLCAPAQQLTGYVVGRSASLALGTRGSLRENGKLNLAGFGLNSTSASRILSFNIDESTWLALYDLPIAATPSGKDSVWSALMPMRDARIAEPHYTDVLARVRVVKRERTP